MNRTITIFGLWEQTDCYCWTGISAVMRRRCLLFKVDYIIVRRLRLRWLRLLLLEIGKRNVLLKDANRNQIGIRLPVEFAGPLDSR